MEEEEILRDVVPRLLQRDGFQVIEACTESEGLELLRQRSGEIAAVLIDLSLADSCGCETVEAIRKLRFDMPVVVSGGYEGPEETGRFSETGHIEFFCTSCSNRTYC
jgi:ActR/RegA family two-component response regulator